MTETETPQGPPTEPEPAEPETPTTPDEGGDEEEGDGEDEGEGPYDWSREKPSDVLLAVGLLKMLAKRRAA